ncbi:MAG: hypothetical protein JXR95_01385 [Deltaproteobacteria bacterium]|nr:hypothetical protein [Deltaproteobacteria bacterium]
MASLTKQTETKRRMKRVKSGKARKNQMSAKSTLSNEELFAGFGEPGQKTPEK